MENHNPEIQNTADADANESGRPDTETESVISTAAPANDGMDDSAEESFQDGSDPAAGDSAQAAVKAAVEAIVYVTEEPVTRDQIAQAVGCSEQQVYAALLALQGECQRADRGLEIREIAGGFKMFTKAEHHDTIRQFVKSLTPPLKLSMAALETLAAIAYRQPVTVPEIQQIRGVNATGVLKTLLDRKLIATTGRKNVIGRPILYKTTREFLVKFGLSSLDELPTLEEFGELARAALGDRIEEEVAERTGAVLLDDPAEAEVAGEMDTEAPQNASSRGEVSMKEEDEENDTETAGQDAAPETESTPQNNDAS